MTLEPNAPQTIHATAVVLGERAVILRGAPGSGKSRLALALINLATPRQRNMLIGDDRIHVSPRHGRLVVSGHAAIAGLIELRGAGILTMPFLQRAVARLIVDCNRAPERLPDPESLWDEIAGIRLPRAFVDASAGAGDAARRVLTLAALAQDHQAWVRISEPRPNQFAKPF